MKRNNKIIAVVHLLFLAAIIVLSVLHSYGLKFGRFEKYIRMLRKSRKKIDKDNTSTNNNHSKKSNIPSLDYGTGNMFDLIATRYDFVNRLLALNMDMSWRRTMVQELGLLPGDKVLDLATGTADVAILIATEGLLAVDVDDSNACANSNEDQVCSNVDEKRSSSVEVLGLDPSQNMIAVGKEKVKALGLDDLVRLDIADARALSGVKDSSFDKATMSFGIRNVPEREKVLCEIHRVLKKNDNSKMAILEFSEPGEESGIMGFGARLFIRHVVPVIGALFSGAPTEYLHLQNSIKHFPSPSEFNALIANVKCGKGKKKSGGFHVEPVINMNFGSVQLYQASPF